jgi:hypothetical protein
MVNIISKFRKYILSVLLIILSTHVWAYQILQEIPALRGGLDEKKLALCMKTVQRRCKTTRLTVNTATCIQQAFMTRKNDCQQSLALYQATQGVIQRWRKFDKITIINTSIPSRFYVGDYFMLTPEGHIVGLVSLPWVTAQPYATSRSEAQLQIWPIALQIPKAYPVLLSGANKIVFKQLLAPSCKTCRPRGYVEVAYLFNPKGNYIKWAVQTYKVVDH